MESRGAYPGPCRAARSRDPNSQPAAERLPFDKPLLQGRECDSSHLCLRRSRCLPASGLERPAGRNSQPGPCCFRCVRSPRHERSLGGLQYSAVFPFAQEILFLAPSPCGRNIAGSQFFWKIRLHRPLPGPASNAAHPFYAFCPRYPFAGQARDERRGPRLGFGGTHSGAGAALGNLPPLVLAPTRLTCTHPRGLCYNLASVIKAFSILRLGVLGLFMTGQCAFAWHVHPISSRSPRATRSLRSASPTDSLSEDCRLCALATQSRCGSLIAHSGIVGSTAFSRIGEKPQSIAAEPSLIRACDRAPPSL